MTRPKFETIDEYIRIFPAGVQKILENLRLTIRKEIPGAEEGISYGIPVFKIDGKFVIYFAAFKKHISLYPIPTGDTYFQKEIAPYVKGKGTISFALDKPIPYGLVKKIVQESIVAHKARDKK